MKKSNTKPRVGRPGGLKGYVHNWKTWIFGWPVDCGLQKRVGQHGAHYDGKNNRVGPWAAHCTLCGVTGYSMQQGGPVRLIDEPAKNSSFWIGNTALQPARPAVPPFIVILYFKTKYFKENKNVYSNTEGQNLRWFL